MLIFVISIPVFSQQNREVPEEMDNLKFLVGEWESTTVFYNAEGKPRDTMLSVSSRKMILRGRGILSEGIINGEVMGYSIYTYDMLNKRYISSSIDGFGNYDHFKGSMNENSLAFQIDEKPWWNGKMIIWKGIYYDIEDDKHKFRMEYSFDSGKSWTLGNIQYFTRKAP